MRWLFACVVLLFAVAMAAQQPNDQGNSSPNSMPAIEQQQPEMQQPALTNSDALYQIQSRLSTSPELGGSQLSTTVTDDTVTVSGYVGSDEQRDAALRLAEEFSGGRQIVNRIKVGGLPGGG